jgi:hypothetical protein
MRFFRVLAKNRTRLTLQQQQYHCRNKSLVMRSQVGVTSTTSNDRRRFRACFQRCNEQSQTYPVASLVFATKSKCQQIQDRSVTTRCQNDNSNWFTTMSRGMRKLKTYPRSFLLRVFGDKNGHEICQAFMAVMRRNSRVKIHSIKEHLLGILHTAHW